eukprot:TRINITY_DN7745_c0_g1_i2.p1 TRINITY_DN7745_c0_g1~~TRINITY_DN7745_c0_g1_i2.p1  ORF type:complete len:510 (+),score=94.38 TRINITY_DN7745_c0_g1_i2:71-1531(+)
MCIRDRYEHLERVFRIFQMVDGKYEVLRNVFRKFIEKSGTDVMVERDNEQAAGEKNKDTEINFVKNLINYYERHHQIVEKCFHNNIYFDQAFKEGVETFLRVPIQGNGVPVMLANFSDSILRSSGQRLSEDERENYIDKLIKLYANIDDKDVFLDIYKAQLAKRLLQGKSESNDAEKMMISKITLLYGAQFTKPFEGMINDVDQASNIDTQFMTYLEKSGSRLNFECHFKVLCKAHWPSYKVIEIPLPGEINAIKEDFEKFYSTQNNYRVLEWIHSLSTMTVVVKYPGEKKIDLRLTVYQAALILLFDGKDTLTFAELRALLNCDDDFLKKHLHSMISKVKVLLKNSDPDTISPDDSFTFNLSLPESSKKRYIDLPAPVLDELANKEKLSEDRGLAIEAAIVRIMKSRRVLEYHLLVNEVGVLLKQFRPETKQIKKRIDSLIEKEFLERDSQDRNTIKYISQRFHFKGPHPISHRVLNIASFVITL